LLKTYYRLNKPGIIYGNALTLTGGFLLASKGHIDLITYLAVLAGTVLVIASACVLNNYIDRDIDKLMARTEKRALAQGTISGRAALSFATVLGITGFVILMIWTNRLTVIIGAIALIDYVVLYGYAKRHSWHGTLVGTVAGSAPIVAGYVAVTNSFDVGALLLCLILATWQMAHFYAIAMYRTKDYKAAGIPVISVVKGMNITKLQIMCYIVASSLATASLTGFGYTGITFLLVMTALGTFWFWRGARTYATAAADSWGRQMFGVSLIVLLGLSLMLSVGSQLP